MTGNTNKHPNATHPDRAYIEAINDLGGEASTKDIANVLDVTPQTVKNHLHDLVEDGCVERLVVGQAYLWRVTENDDD